MSEDLKDIKKRILEDGYIQNVLEALDCEHISEKNNRFEAQLPQKFESPNKRSVQVYKNESLSSRIRSLGESDLDIYGLISYFLYDAYTDAERLKTLPKAKKWLCERLGYHEYLGNNSKPKLVNNHLSWLKEVKRNRKKKRNLNKYENEIYDNTILNDFIMLPHQSYLREGVFYRTQLEFGIGYDLRTQRIIFPIHNRYGELISIKGRTIYEDYQKRDIYKFMYLINFNKMLEWYNWHRALYYILESKEVIIYEGEKTCWLSSQWGVRNCLAISGDDISDWQVNMIKELGADLSIIFALDKDKDVAAIKKQAIKFGKVRNLYALYDQDNLFSDRDSPTDNGEELFKLLYDNYKFKITV